MERAEKGDVKQEEGAKREESTSGERKKSNFSRSTGVSPAAVRKPIDKAKARTTLDEVVDSSCIDPADKVYKFLRSYFLKKRPEISMDRRENVTFSRWLALTDIEMLRIFKKMDEEEKKHVIFVVHGIGQSLVEYCDIVDDSMELKKAFAEIETNFVGINEKRENRKSTGQTLNEGNVDRKDEAGEVPEASSPKGDDEELKVDTSSIDEKELYKKKIQVTFIPIQWRRSLDLDGNNGEDGVKVGDVTLEGVKSLRNILHGTFLDVLHYMNQRTSRTIMRNLTKEFNRAFKRYMLRNPSFEMSGGKTSIVAHSLGTVLSFDLLCQETMLLKGEENLEEDDNDRKENLGTASENSSDIDNLKQELMALHNKIKVLEAKKKQSELKLVSKSENVSSYGLDFQVTNFFALGSPLGIFITLKYLKSYEFGVEHDVDHLGNFFVLPKCQNMYNIFHPYDPVGYRIEPCIAVRFKENQPELVAYHKGGKRIHHAIKDWSDGIFQGGEKLKQNLFTGLSSLTSFMSKKSEEETNSKEGGSKNRTFMRMESIPKDLSEKEQENLLLKSFNFEGRVDFMLQDSLMESQYLSAVTSHNGYWQNPDVSLFILSHLYKEEYLSELRETAGVELEVDLSESGPLVESDILSDECVHVCANMPESELSVPFDSRRKRSSSPSKTHQIDGASPFALD